MSLLPIIRRQATRATLIRTVAQVAHWPAAKRGGHWVPTLSPFKFAERTQQQRDLRTVVPHSVTSFTEDTPPPRNAGVPDTSIAGTAYEASHETQVRLERDRTGFTGPKIKPTSTVTESEGEAQLSRPASATTTGDDTTDLPTSSPTTTPLLKGQSRGKLRSRKAAMALTPTAIEQLRQLLSQPQPKLIRVGVKNRGCSGLAYHLEYVEKPSPFDEKVEQDGVQVLIDSKALFSIIGSEMDWVEDKLSSRFVFRNPNISASLSRGSRRNPS